MIGYPEIKELESSGIVAAVADADGPGVKDARLRGWWGEQGVEYSGIERWAQEQAVDDLEMALELWGPLLAPEHVAAMLATAWDMGTMMGFRLAVEATVRA